MAPDLCLWLLTHLWLRCLLRPNPNPSFYLQAVFKVPQMRLSSLADLLQPLLQPMEPITFKYQIHLGGRSPTQPMVIDFDFDLTSFRPTQDKISTIIDKLGRDKEVEACEQAIQRAIRHINEHRRRRAFFLGYSHSPVDFVNAVIASQARDLRQARGASPAGRDFDVGRRSDTFREKWVQEAVVRYLQRRQASGH